MGIKTTAFTFLTKSVTISTGLFAGGAVYITLVEHPSRRTLDTKAMYMEWRESLIHAKPMPVCALAASLSGILAYVLKPKAKGIPWLIAGGTMAVLLPYTALVMWPFAIGPIYSPDRAEKKGEEYVKEHIEKWNKMHAVRTVVSVAVFAWCVYNFKK